MYFKEKILKVVKLLQEDFKQNIKEKKMKLKFEVDFKKIFIVGFLTIIALVIKISFVAIVLNFLEQFYYEFVETDSSFTKIFYDPKTVVFYAALVVFGIDAVKYNYNYICSCDDEEKSKNKKC